MFLGTVSETHGGMIPDVVGDGVMVGQENHSGMGLSKKRPTGWVWLFQIAVLGSLIALAIFKMRQGQLREQPPLKMLPFASVAPLTELPGFESFPALAPNGQAVSFAWQKDPMDRRTTTHIKTLAFDTQIQLTANPGQENYATWDPMSSSLAFARLETSGVTGIYQMPMVGGKEQKILETHSKILGLDWSPDGEALLLAEQKHASAPSSITRVTLQDSFRLNLTDPPKTGFGDRQPVFSPDGQKVAFVRTNGLQRDGLILISKTGDNESLILQNAGHIHGLAWHPDGKHLIFGSLTAGEQRIRRVNIEDQSVKTLLANRLGAYPTLSDDGETMVFEAAEMKSETRLYQRFGDKKGELVPWGAGHQVDGASFSPDGSKLAFVSSRSGKPEIWMVAADAKPQRLTHFKGKDLKDPHWSPDGQSLAWTVFDDSGASVYTLALGENAAVRVVGDFGNGVCRGWSADGDALMIASNQSGAWNLWRYDMVEKQLKPLTKDGGFQYGSLADQNAMYISRFGERTIDEWSLNGETTQVFEEEEGEVHWHWQVGKDGLYFQRKGFGQIQLCLFEFRTGRTIVLNRFAPSESMSFAIAPDGQSYLVTRNLLVDKKLMVAKVMAP